MDSVAVIGPPGTGKTTAIMREIVTLLAHGAGPDEIAVVTFTRVAASDTRHRLVGQFPKYRMGDFPWVGTIHSLCRRLLDVPSSRVFSGAPVAEFCRRFPQYRFTIEHVEDYGDGDDALEIRDQMLRTPGDWLEHFDSRRRNAMISFHEQQKYFVRSYDLAKLPLGWTPETQALYCRRKQAFLEESGCFDFASMLETVLRQRRRLPGVRFLFVDEAQDNSPLLWAVLNKWAEPMEKFICLGDPDQAIYSDFLPAPPQHFLRFIERASRTELQQSYRLPRSVQAVSEKWIGQNRERVARTFSPRPVEGVVKGFCRLDGLDWDRYVPAREGEVGRRAFVLARTRWQASALKQWFNEQGIPYETNRGQANPIQTAKGGLALALARLVEGEPVRAAEMAALRRWMPARPWFSHGAKTEFLKAIDDFPDQMVDWAYLSEHGFTPAFIETLNPKDFLQSLKIPAWERAYMKKCYDRYGRLAFERSPSIMVTNIHAVKGLEADDVVIDPNIDGMPARSFQEAPEEERRVAYVGITRAREGLYVLAPDYGADAFWDLKVARAAGGAISIAEDEH